MTHQRGAAMPGAILALAATIILTTAITSLVRTELAVTRSRGAATGGLAAADACAARATAGLPAGWGLGWDLGAALLGPDALAGTPDDGMLSASAGCTVAAAAAPGAGAPPSRLLAEVDAQAGPGRRKFAAVIGRPREPGVRAVIWLADAGTLGAVGGTISLDGSDPLDPTSPARASLGAPVDPVTLDTWLAAEAGRITIGAGTDAPITTPAPPLAALVARVRAGSHAGPEVLTPPGPPPVPSLALADGDFAVGGDSAGAGLFVVDGTLIVGASLEFAGVLVATRGIQIAPGARLVVRGALWIGSPLVGPPLGVDGQLTVTHDAAAIAAADVLHTLPRRAAILGVRDHG